MDDGRATPPLRVKQFKRGQTESTALKQKSREQPKKSTVSIA